MYLKVLWLSILLTHKITCTLTRVRLFFKKVGHSRPLFIYFRLFNTVDNKQMLNKILPMTGVKPRASGIKSDRSTNWATTTSRQFVLCQLFLWVMKSRVLLNENKNIPLKKVLWLYVQLAYLCLFLTFQLMLLFLPMGQSRPLFVFYFRSFHIKVQLWT